MKRRPRIMLKLGVFVLLFLTGGAIVNVAVAWGCAALVRPHTVHGMNDSLKFVTDTSGFPIVLCAMHKMGRTRTSHYPGKQKPLDEYGSNVEWLREGARGSADCCGWPFAALECTNNADAVVLRYGSGGFIIFDGDPNAQLDRGIALSPWTTGPGVTPTWRALPLGTLWPGFAINTIFYAAILALLFYGPGKVRRTVRIRRSQCPACGHIIASGTCANGLCSECGSALPWMRKSPTCGVEAS
jgi:hypothetical protein